MYFLNTLEFQSVVLDSDTEDVSERAACLPNLPVNREIAAYFPGKKAG